MSDIKIAGRRLGENSTLETSSAIKDDELKDIVGGKFSWFPTVDEKNKLIRVLPEDIENFDNSSFRNFVKEVYSAEVDKGFTIIFTTGNTGWGPEAK